MRTKNSNGSLRGRKKIDYDEISYSEIEDCIIDAKEGKLSSYWQGYAEREFDALRTDDGKLPERARELYKEYKKKKKNVPQIESDETNDAVAKQYGV